MAIFLTFAEFSGPVLLPITNAACILDGNFHSNLITRLRRQKAPFILIILFYLIFRLRDCFVGWLPLILLRFLAAPKHHLAAWRPYVHDSGYHQILLGRGIFETSMSIVLLPLNKTETIRPMGSLVFSQPTSKYVFHILVGTFHRSLRLGMTGLAVNQLATRPHGDNFFHNLAGKFPSIIRLKYVRCPEETENVQNEVSHLCSF